MTLRISPPAEMTHCRNAALTRPSGVVVIIVLHLCDAVTCKGARYRAIQIAANILSDEVILQRLAAMAACFVTGRAHVQQCLEPDELYRVMRAELKVVNIVFCGGLATV
jgi:hypothetical protein